jgi:hypothetical protein
VSSVLFVFISDFLVIEDTTSKQFCIVFQNWEYFLVMSYKFLIILLFYILLIYVLNVFVLKLFSILSIAYVIIFLKPLVDK